MTFKLTYSTMFDPPEEMHARFEAALGEVRAGLGATHAMHVGGRDVAAARTYEKRSPVDRRLVLGRFPLGDAATWTAPWPRRRAPSPAGAPRRPPSGCASSKRVSALLEERVYDDRRRPRPRGRQEPHGGPRRDAGDGRLLLRLRGGVRAERLLRPRPARRPAPRLPLPQPLASSSPTACGRSSRPSTSPSRSPAGPSRRRSSPATRSSSRARPTRRGPAASSPTASATRASRPASSTT